MSKAALEQMTRERDNVTEACKEIVYENRQLKEIIAAHNTVQAGDSGLGYHVWMPTENNHLESLTCPLLVPAEWLRNMLEEAARTGKVPFPVFDEVS